MSKVRIILPTYNRPALVLEAIDSVLAQTYKNWELIVSNDGSTDDTEKIVQKVGMKDRRIRILNSQNGGIARARNRAIELAGEYDFIAFLDDDDQWLPQHLQESIEFLQLAKNVDLIFSQAKTVDLTGSWSEEKFLIRDARMRKPVQFATESPKDGWYILNNASCWQAFLRSAFAAVPSTVVVRREAVSREPWFDVTLEIFEDLELWLYLIQQGSSFGFLNSIHVVLRYQGDNLTGGFLDLSSPILARRYESVLRYEKIKYHYCTDQEDRKIASKEISKSAYFLGQCYSEQGNILSARLCYREALKYKVTWLVFKGFLFSLLPQLIWRSLRSGYHKLVEN